MKRCLITGASGFLGGELCPFVSEHYRVTAQGFRSTSPDQLALDLRDNRSVSEMIAMLYFVAGKLPSHDQALH